MPKNKKKPSPLSPPPRAKENEWAIKVEKAIQIRESAAEAQKGLPLSFPTGMRRR